jgi:preprotein translocase subunit SecF
VNQTMVRSINTTVIGLLPITAVLAVGAIWLGPGVLLDLSLVLFVGILVGAYSSIFIATPLLVTLRRNDAAVLELDKRAARHQARKAKDVAAAEAAEAAGDDIDDTLVGVGSGTSGAPAAAAGDSSTLSGRAVHKYAQSGPRNQPRRPPKSKR